MHRLQILEGGTEPLTVALALAPDTLVIDVEPLVTGWGTGEGELRAGLVAVECAVPEDVHVVFATNSGRRPSAMWSPARAIFVSRAGKPWRTGWVVRSARTVVIGDQFFTDGLLAWRLHALALVRVPLPIGAPLWPRLQHRVAQALIVSTRQPRVCPTRP